MATKLKPLFNPATSAHNEDGAKLSLQLDTMFSELIAEHPDYNPREFMFIAIDSATKIGIQKSVEVSEAIAKEARMKD
jgi:hypothetical protein